MMSGKPSKIIIDCDPGADDAIALMLACSSPELSVLGVLAATGNAPAAMAAGNACRILSLCHREDIPVFKGADDYLHGGYCFDHAYCGADGLCETGLFGHDSGFYSENGIRWLIHTLMNTDEPIRVLSIAPMTNLASAIRQEPGITRKIECIITTSGYYGLCPQPVRREWNLAVDPYAAKAVFDASIPIYALGLDVTAKLDRSFADRILKMAGQGQKGEFLRRACQFYLTKGLEPFSLFVDAMAVAFAVCPEIAAFTAGTVSLRPDSRTDADFMRFYPAENEKAAVHAAHSFNFRQFETLLRERVFDHEISHLQ